MNRPWMMLLVVVAAAAGLMGTGGCEGDDARLAEYAKSSIHEQAQQNQEIARQSQAVTEQNRQVAEAARKLVEADGMARHELVSAQQSLQAGLQAERSTLDDQRHELEQERKDLARERYWEPLIAEAIGDVGLLAACLAPLLLCYHLLCNLHAATVDETALNELLVSELAAESPRLLLEFGDDHRSTVSGSPDDPRLESDPRQDSEPDSCQSDWPF